MTTLSDTKETTLEQDRLMPDAPRVGGITPFLKVAALAEHAGLMLAPHFAMELHPSSFRNSAPSKRRQPKEILP
jgi:L-alanine-DL-glutamate epimerase-like enolase superfamily enzyme